MQVDESMYFPASVLSFTRRNNTCMRTHTYAESERKKIRKGKRMRGGRVSFYMCVCEHSVYTISDYSLHKNLPHPRGL